MAVFGVAIYSWFNMVFTSKRHLPQLDLCLPVVNTLLKLIYLFNANIIHFLVPPLNHCRLTVDISLLGWNGFFLPVQRVCASGRNRLYTHPLLFHLREFLLDYISKGGGESATIGLGRECGWMSLRRYGAPASVQCLHGKCAQSDPVLELCHGSTGEKGIWEGSKEGQSAYGKAKFHLAQ